MHKCVLINTVLLNGEFRLARVGLQWVFYSDLLEGRSISQHTFLIKKEKVIHTEFGFDDTAGFCNCRIIISATKREELHDNNYRIEKYYFVCSAY